MKTKEIGYTHIIDGEYTEPHSIIEFEHHKKKKTLAVGCTCWKYSRKNVIQYVSKHWKELKEYEG